LFLGRKSQVGLKMPWSVRQSRRIFPLVVVSDSRPQVFSEANVAAIRIFSTLKQIDVVHADRVAAKIRVECPATPRLRSALRHALLPWTVSMRNFPAYGRAMRSSSGAKHGGEGRIRTAEP
jgi:hypothetical protein